MKTNILSALALVVILSGCSLLPPNYDNNEYMQFARLETHSRFLREECVDPVLVRNRLDLMLFDAELLNSYSFFLPRNSEIFEISKILATDVREMMDRYDDGEAPSITYCKIKSKAFTTKARRALESIGDMQTE
jgi:hypothetical protein